MFFVIFKIEMVGNIGENEVVGVWFDWIDNVWLIFVKCVWIILVYGEVFVVVYDNIDMVEDVMMVEIVNVIFVFII